MRLRAGCRPPARLRSAPASRRGANRRLHPELARRRRGRTLLAAGVPLGAVLVFLACRAAFQEGFFRVREISFRGLVHAQPAVLVAEAGLARRRSMFDNFDFVSANLARDPLVREARVRRELPARLVVEVQERAPAAYWAADSALVVVDAEGRVLPLDPARYGWDLPVLMAPRPAGGHSDLHAGRIVDGDARALLRLVIGIRDGVPEVSRRISTAELEAGGRVVLHLMGEGGEVRLRLETPIAKVALLPDVVRDLELKREGFQTLDLSFQDQIVVRPVRLPDPAPEAASGDDSAHDSADVGSGRSPGAEPFAVGAPPAADSGPGASPPTARDGSPPELAPLPFEPPPAAPDPGAPGPAAWRPFHPPGARPAGPGGSPAGEPSYAERPA